MKITAQLLREHNACSDGLDAFERVFPDGAELTPENVRAAVAAGLDVGWAARVLRLTVTLEYSYARVWYRDGKLHRDDGPAIEYASGTREWYRDGKIHRDDGPAIEYASGTRVWYRDGKLHRDDGPAIECANGEREWFRHGERER